MGCVSRWTRGRPRTQISPMARLTIRIDLDERAGFGPGKARLLEKLDEIGSIRGAAAAMDMSYRRAWMLVQDMEATMGAPVIVARTGGSGGGGVTLTRRGRSVLDQYRKIERLATESVAAELRVLAKLCVCHAGETKRRSIAGKVKRAKTRGKQKRTASQSGRRRGVGS